MVPPADPAPGASDPAAAEPAAEPTAEPAVEPTAEPAARSAAPPGSPPVVAPPDPTPDGQPDAQPEALPRPVDRRTLALAAAALVGVLAGGVVAWQVVGPEDSSPSPAASLPIDGWPIAGESRAVTEVLRGGELQVTHWIHADAPIDEMGLALPELNGADVSATRVQVTADGRAAAGPATVTPRGATYTFADATRIQVRYVMSGAVELSSSADGRGLATTTSLEVTATQARDVRVVRSQEVLSLACAQPDEQPVPCGQAEADDEWRVELSGAEARSRVLAVVTVPS